MTARLLAVLLLCPAVVLGQTVYNPSFIAWDKDPVDDERITRYVLVLTDDLGRAWPELVVPSSLRQEETATTWRLPWSAFPSLPVGRTYTLRLRACTDEGGCSDASNPAPGTARVQSCVAAGKLVLPGLAVGPLLPSPRVGAFMTLAWTATLAARPRSLRVDLIGDGQPAWYVPVQQSEFAFTTVVGPFARAGTFAVEAAVTDENGCEASLPFGSRLTVVP